MLTATSVESNVFTPSVPTHDRRIDSDMMEREQDGDKMSLGRKVNADVKLDDATEQPDCGEKSTTCHRLQELTELLEDVTKLEKTMMEAKQAHEKLYVTLKKDLHQKIKSVQYLEKEMNWLKSECTSTERVCGAVNMQKDCKEGQIKNLLSNKLDLDVDEAAGRLPKIYRQYRGLKTAEDGDQLIAEIEATKTQLNKLQHLTNVKLRSISRENNSQNGDRLPRTNNLLRSILERMAASTDNRRGVTDDTSIVPIQADSPQQSADSTPQPIRSLLDTIMSGTHNFTTSNETSAPVTMNTTSNMFAGPDADSSHLLEARISDQWLHTYREVMTSTLPTSSLLSNVLTAEQYATEEPQLCEIDLLPDEFGTIL